MKRPKLLPQKTRQFFGILVVLIVAVIGINYLVTSHADSPEVTVEAESGKLSGDAVVQSDSNASNSNYVMFASNDACKPDKLPTVSIDSALTNDISGQLGPGWIAGDASYSTQLPDGREAFDFSDTLIGTAQTDGSATFTGFIHNSELVGTPTNLVGDYGGTETAPTTLVPDSNGGTNQWQVAATYVENGDQLIFVNEFIPVTGSPFDSYVGVSAVLDMSIPSGGLPTLNSVTAIPTDADTQWGNAVTSDATYHYIYGENTTGMKLARVPLNDTLTASDWQYWNGKTWVSSEASAVVLDTTNEFTGVASSGYDGGYMALSIKNSVYDTIDNKVNISYSCTPQGPWSTPAAIYTIPEVTQYPDEIAYMSTFHPELNDSGGIVASYDIDDLDGLTSLEANIHEYQPRFLYLNTSTSVGEPIPSPTPTTTPTPTKTSTPSPTPTKTTTPSPTPTKTTSSTPNPSPTTTK
jgi:hypothetical protein